MPGIWHKVVAGRRIYGTHKAVPKKHSRQPKLHVTLFPSNKMSRVYACMHVFWLLLLKMQRCQVMCKKSSPNCMSLNNYLNIFLTPMRNLTGLVGFRRQESVLYILINMTLPAYSFGNH